MKYSKSFVKSWLGDPGVRYFRTCIEVGVEGLLGSLQNQMTICAMVDVAGNGAGDTRREPTLQVLTNQTNSLPTSHFCPLNNLSPAYR